MISYLLYVVCCICSLPEALVNVSGNYNRSKVEYCLSKIRLYAGISGSVVDIEKTTQTIEPSV